MQIIFHLGAHCTDGGLLIRSILRNRAALSQEGVLVPGPSRYRELLGDISTTLRGEIADDDTEAMVIEAICDDDTADRIVLSNENFLCRAPVALDQDRLYPKAAKSAWLRNCLPNHDVEFAIAIRNPATFLPDIAKTTGAQDAFDELSLGDMLWSEVLQEIHASNPSARILVWSHEDTPFIWSEVVREITGLDPMTKLEGEFDMLETIMSPDGMTRLSEFIASHDGMTQSKRRRAVSAFLEAHAISDAIEEEIDLPGWTDATVAGLTELYEEDVSSIKRIPNVTFIEP
ncbi:MAG: hypothetical protein ABJF50_02090 [Paracoccaceae bacterium]